MKIKDAISELQRYDQDERIGLRFGSASELDHNEYCEASEFDIEVNRGGRECVLFVAVGNPHSKFSASEFHEVHDGVHALFEDWDRKLDALLAHCDKEGGECSVCSEIICPHKCELHFHHDGCPACCNENHSPSPNRSQP